MKRKKVIFRATLLAYIIYSSLVPTYSYARNWSFDPTQLGSAGDGVDMSVFNQGGQLPGRYLVDILLNGQIVDTKEMLFHQSIGPDDHPVLKTCLTREALTGYGIKVADFDALFPVSSNTHDTDCAALEAIPGATEELQLNNQQLLLSIPQIALEPKLRGIAPKGRWNDGVPALLLNYQVDVSHTDLRGMGKKHGSEVYFARLDPGINLGSWRLRTMKTYRKSGRQAGKWQTSDTWAERGLYGLKSRLTIGNRYTPSDIFESVPFKGVMLGSDNLMVPYYLREVAPVVRGIARTQARIDVRQRGIVIYSTTVAPGPFALTDLSTSSSGDLEVTVQETDGHPQVFIVPWTPPAIAVHEGYLNYNIMAGQYRPVNTGVQQADVAQITAMYGLPWGMTVYGGLQWAEHYQGTALGAGALIGKLGALSLDGIQGYGKLPGGQEIQGQTRRLRYNKIFDVSKTGISLTASHYSPSGAVSLENVLDKWRAGNNEGFYFGNRTDIQKKDQTMLNLSQSLFGMGYINLNASRSHYWKGRGNQDELTLSLSSATQGINWSLNWTQRKTPQFGNMSENRYKREQETSLWVSIPLERWFNDTSASYQMLSGYDGKVKHEVGMNGSGFDQRLSWGVRQQYLPGEVGDSRNNGSMNLSWNGAYGVVDGGYSYGESYRQVNAGLSGGVIVHEHGVTVGQQLGKTTALVSTPGVSGVSVGNWSGIKTDYRGYTIMAGLSPYRENTIALEPMSLPPDAEILKTEVKVVPTDGAVLPVRFPTRIGARAVVTLHLSKGKPVPFGAVVTVGNDSQAGGGIVGENGDVYIGGLPNKGELKVQWGVNKQCKVEYQLPAKAEAAGIYHFGELCR